MPHHHHGPHHGPHHGRIVAHYNPELVREQYANALIDLGKRLAKAATVHVNGTAITVPATVEFQLIYERTPHGSLKLKLEADWPEEYSAVDGPTSPTLLFGGPHEVEE